MGDEQGTLSPEQAVEAELARIVRTVHNDQDVRVWGLRIMSAAFPGFTRARWLSLATGRPMADPWECKCPHCEDRDNCIGDCEPCSDYSCSQCWPEGCPGSEDVYACCGYCDDCRHHHSDVERPEVCDRGYCHECSHDCESYEDY